MNCRLPIVLTVSMLGATVFLPPLAAQGRGGHLGAARAPRAGGGFRSGARSGFGYGPWGQRGFGFFPGWAFLPPPYYPDYDYDYQQTQAPPPWAVVAQPEVPSVPPKPIEPLVIERQGDQWVRIGGYGQSAAAAQSMPPSAGQAPTPPSEITGRIKSDQPAPKLPPVVLVFRDGRQEEIEKYTIIGPVIYTPADYWSTGSWTRKVAIADLDVPATLKLNRERGGTFGLPSGPHEVVVRP